MAVVFGVLGWAWTGTPLLNCWLDEGAAAASIGPAKPVLSALLPRLAVAKLGDVVVATLAMTQSAALCSLELCSTTAGGAAGNGWRLQLAVAHGPQVVIGVVFATPSGDAASVVPDGPFGAAPVAVLPHPTSAASALLAAAHLAHTLAHHGVRPRGWEFDDDADTAGPQLASGSAGRSCWMPPEAFSCLLDTAVQRDAVLRDERTFTSARVLQDRESAEGRSGGLTATSEYRTVPPSLALLAAGGVGFDEYCSEVAHSCVELLSAMDATCSAGGRCGVDVKWALLQPKVSSNRISAPVRWLRCTGSERTPRDALLADAVSAAIEPHLIAAVSPSALESAALWSWQHRQRQQAPRTSSAPVHDLYFMVVKETRASDADSGLVLAVPMHYSGSNVEAALPATALVLTLFGERSGGDEVPHHEQQRRRHSSIGEGAHGSVSLPLWVGNGLPAASTSNPRGATVLNADHSWDRAVLSRDTVPTLFAGGKHPSHVVQTFRDVVGPALVRFVERVAECERFPLVLPSGGVAAAGPANPLLHAPVKASADSR